jgi:diguanylate cyclase (GGDEF)-like protein/PAS domain S-box-containing protein
MPQGRGTSCRWDRVPDYEMDVKGRAFLETFVDPGPAFDPSTGPHDGFGRAVIEQASDMVIAFGHDGTISYANDAVRVLLGYEPSSIVGTNALDLVAPDDLDNAARTIHHAAEVVGWRPPRPFRLVHADGRWITFEVAGLSLFDHPDVQAIVIVARWADASSRVDRVLGLLAGARPTTEVLAELVHLLDRPGWELAVALQFDDGDGGFTAVASRDTDGLDGLTAVDEGPWATARQTGVPVVDVGLETVPPAIRSVAAAAGFVTCWAVPVTDPIGAPACLVVWNAEPVEPELGQDLVLRRLVSLVELALDGRARSQELQRAASCDPLTGLWNRRYLEAAASARDRAPGDQMAVVLCDLDGFKQVNDAHGHPAGDHVIRTVATRLRAAVRSTDVVARFGGDEFAILLPGVDAGERVEGLARRLIEDVCEPIEHEGALLHVGVSIGVAVCAPGGPCDLAQLVGLADVRLLEAKAAGKATFRITDLSAVG